MQSSLPQKENYTLYSFISGAQALTLWERIRASQARETLLLDATTVRAWRERVDLNERGNFLRRLSLAQLDESPFLDLPEAPPVFAGNPGLPLYRRHSLKISGGHSLPAQHRFTRVRAMLIKIAGNDCDVILNKISEQTSVTSHYVESVRTSLFKRLLAITGQILVYEFKRYALRALEGSIVRDASLLDDTQLETLAEGYFDTLSTLSLDSFGLHYPVWARLKDLEVKRWGRQALTLVERFEQDRAQINATFGITLDDRLQSVNASGDTHRDGETVAILTFMSGKQLVYKPRSGCLDLWYRDLLDWITQQDEITLAIKAPAVVDRDDYCWIEFIPHEKSSDSLEEQRFYQRMGMLLAIWSAFGGSDGHFENVIARGEFPYVIDTETLFDGQGMMRRSSRVKTGSELCSYRLGQSIKRVGFLPTYLKPKEDVEPFDLSAIGLRAPIPAPFYSPDIERRLSYVLGLLDSERQQVQPQGNVPNERSGPLGAELLAAIERGYSEVYDLVGAKAVQIIRRVRRLAQNPRARVRVVLRPTHLYSRLLTESLKPECMMDGARRSIEIDRLSLNYTCRRPTRYDGELLAAEIHALENLDIPLFDVPLTRPVRVAQTCDLQGKISRRQLKSPAQSAIENMRQRSPADKTFQLRLLRETLLIDDGVRLREGFVFKNERILDMPNHVVNSDVVWSRIHEIERLVTDSAIVGSDGSFGWIAPLPLSNKGHYQHREAGNSLYGGASGVALFYSALHKVTGDPDFRRKALSSLTTLIRSFNGNSKNRSESSESHLRVLYPVISCSKLLNEPWLMHSVSGVLNQVTSKTFSNDTSFDVIEGSAGAILNLLSLWKETDNQLALSIAVQAGEHLLKCRTTTPAGFKAWNTLGAPLAGFAHGVAGIALSLERLSNATRDARFKDASLEALAYERSLYSETQRNWPDLRPTASGAPASYLPSAWCHGATGIGLAYLGISECRSDDLLEESISLARLSTMLSPVHLNDTLCCGLLSRATFFDLLARRCGDNEAGTIRDKAISDFVDRGVMGSRLVDGVPGFINSAGFFNGLSGIGYELLRMYFDSTLPVVMLWE